MSPFRLSIVSGFCLASLHIFWALLVALGWAQPVLDFIFKLHMVSSPFQVQPFELSLALGLIGFTFFIGCILGFVFSVIEKRFSK